MSRRRMPLFTVLFLAAGAAALALSSCAPGSMPASRTALFGYGAGSEKLMKVSSGYSPARGFKPAQTPKRPPVVLVQATTGATPAKPAADSTSSATVLNTTVESDDPVVVECLKCHGPFAKLAEKTKGYVTEWDEHANPHVYVPHESTTIVTCTDCHEAHALPVASDTKFAKANVQYCYSCHHAETLVACKECHNE